MAANDQAFKAGEAKGQAMEKVGQMGNAVKDKTFEIAGGIQSSAFGAKDMAGGYAISARDTVIEAAQGGKDKFGEGDAAAKAKAEQEKSGGVMQQIQGTAQGALDAVKNTLGMGDQPTKK